MYHALESTSERPDCHQQRGCFMRSKMVDWRTAIPLLVITTLVAPLGVLDPAFRPHKYSVVDLRWCIAVSVLSYGFRSQTG